jgi:hypothetical protein
MIEEGSVYCLKYDILHRFKNPLSVKVTKVTQHYVQGVFIDRNDASTWLIAEFLHLYGPKPSPSKIWKELNK